MSLINLDWGNPETIAMIAFFLLILALIISLELVSPKKKKNRKSTRNVSEREGAIID
ncbi:hypothetical protein [Sphingomonas faeni]|uniref:hypothetical protein n=1 Tax=Sphingomonas faeni TaxID=185950 RepID=UPI00334D4A9C